MGSELGLRVIFVRAVDGKAAGADVTAIAERLERLSAGVNGADCGAGWSVEVSHHPAGLSGCLPTCALPVVVVPPGTDASVDGGAPGTEVAGGIARFALGSDERRA